MVTAGPESNFLLDTSRQRRSLWTAIFAGLFAALSAAMLLCRSPQTSISQMTVVLLAGAYLTATALFGTTGSYLYWVRSYARSASSIASGLPALLQSTVRGWYWIPAIVLLFRKDSAFAPAVAAAGAAILAFSLRREGPAALTPELPAASEQLDHTLFAQSLRTARAEWSGYAVAICVYAAVLVLTRGWLFLACTFLALAAFVFAWNRTPASNAAQYSLKLRSINLGQARSAIPALIVTALAMLAGAGHDLHLWGMGLGHGGATDLPKLHHPPVPAGLSGHVSIILLTAPQKQQFFAPHPTQPLLQGTHLNKPLVIQFDGEYWYFQPPDSGPGPGAYIARESPLVANVHSVLHIPLLMQAHQRLDSPLPLTCCHAIEIDLENRDQSPGALDLSMSVSNSANPGKPVLLGLQHLQSSEGNLWQTHATPAHETLRFSIPVHADINQFNQIDMLIIPGLTRMQSGAKIAIQTIRLLP
ncbi:hypothetical protein ACFPT7_01535 [Acidicapsa dinghuensis]|uniref:Uncharacterized protein n=1 Tax=Acidicapsa dinghuensis TaxID=2218256 RepID=A0ABW1EDA9_9BACT|nr:hypothetical protein [Acidicapsa dinghuensis]